MTLPFTSSLSARLLAMACLVLPAAGVTKPFVHPGLLHTANDFERMRTKVKAGEEPWTSGWKKLEESRHARADWKPRPLEKVVRGGEGQNFPVLFNDIHAAYQLALKWKVGGDTACADKAVEILNAWSTTLKSIEGNSDRCLAAGIYGYQFANAAEIMRTYPGWKPDDFARCQRMMLEVFLPMNLDFLHRHNDAAITNYWANWDLCNMASLQAIGVLCDRRDLYDQALEYFHRGRGNGALDKAVYVVHPGNLGQWQESGRDQGHNTLGIALMGPICETAWNQGDDLYGEDNNRFLAGAEYVAKYNLGEDVPFLPYAWGTGQRGDRRRQDVIASHDRGAMRSGFELVLNHYVHRKGIAAPWCERYAAKIRPEGGGGGHASTFDQFGLGTLTHTLDPAASDPAPVGLTARKDGGTVVLSWWGAAGADRYTVLRSKDPEAAPGVIADDIRDPVTFTDTKPLPGPNYYVVRGFRDDKETRPSGVVHVSMQPELRLHLDFDGNAADRSGGGRDGNPQGGTSWAAGKLGKALSLDGKDGHVALPEGIAADLSDFTVAAWVRPGTDQSWARVFDFGDDRGRYLFLTPRGSNGKARFAVSTVYGYNEQVIDADAALLSGKWSHVAVTLSGRRGTLYVDGVAVGVNEAIDFPPFRLGRTDRNWIGRSQFPNDPFLDGMVDDFRLYDGALSGEEVARLAAAK
ncbi:LamG-like jellyroll fold domain-containing protein [Luteolibacter marinus]|uniref:LamG-like jellyroll fold domain-containing protein n=1 Tax=Luteolibacter marinus TaxID=2776705 RepID=UPI00186659DB|nr:LamG-like jellyroll fold domain-containing protein [Luteolibacter marinus]